VFGRRFLILVAVLMGMTALAASLAPRQQGAPQERREATPTPAPAGTPTLATIEKDLTTSNADVTVNQGDLVELTISGPETDSVLLLNRMDTIHPDSDARFSLLAGRPGEYPIELVDADRQIGTLVIR
jgi:hypothetical protein